MKKVNSRPWIDRETAIATLINECPDCKSGCEGCFGAADIIRSMPGVPVSYVHNPSFPCSCSIKNLYSVGTIVQSIRYCERHRIAACHVPHDTLRAENERLQEVLHWIQGAVTGFDELGSGDLDVINSKCKNALLAVSERGFFDDAADLDEILKKANSKDDVL